MVLDHHPVSEEGEAALSTLHHGDGVQLTLTQDVVDGWKGYFQDHQRVEPRIHEEQCSPGVWGVGLPDTGHPFPV